jgi:hypothetical protein
VIRVSVTCVIREIRVSLIRKNPRDPRLVDLRDPRDPRTRRPQVDPRDRRLVNP